MASLRLRLSALALAALGAAPLARAGSLRDDLGMFFTLRESDSVVTVTQKSPTSLEVAVVDGATGEHRTLQEEVGAKPMTKLMSEARSEGLAAGDSWSATPAATAPADAPSATSPATREPSTAAPARSGGSKVPHSLSSQRKNRLLYMTTQVPLSTWVYGLSIPLALGVDNARVITAMPLLAAPVAFGAHFWFAKTHDFEDSHLRGTDYLSSAALYASYALPFALVDWEDNTAYRTASFLSLAAYPLGIWAGYMLGDRYVDMPGRVETEANFALCFGLLGGLTPLLYFEDLSGHGETVTRLALGQSLAFATAGHFLASYYRSGENIPGGVTVGIMTHTGLGAGLGLEVAALADATGPRAWFGSLLAGGTVGFMESLLYFQHRYDSKEKGFYNSLGTGAGALMGLGILVLADPTNMSEYAAKVTIASSLVGGALLGYLVTDLLTSGMEDRSGMAKPSWTDRVAVNLIPVPEAQVYTRDAYTRAVYYRARIPGVSVHF